MRGPAPADELPSRSTINRILRRHGPVAREPLDDAGPYASVLVAQAALDDWVRAYYSDARTAL